ncbi:hypothetical protein N0V83_008217 [Neocucurbitaria cava]|uniref:RING-type domain-containing protein n=1 Tax=Neocucurbitaria cava TaxID=798079 RepID=A0A9W8Y354_9PLEO|nr:hypothetical protein N0V83_008217 [Neocucurbitaria cava]
MLQGMSLSSIPQPHHLLTHPSIGRKILHFTLPNKPNFYAVHEDIICCTSALIREAMQKHRKPLHRQDDCDICYVSLDPRARNITFCRKCGDNVHEACLQEWWKQLLLVDQREDSSSHVPTCPFCRATWSDDEDQIFHLAVAEDLDDCALQLYVNWLYSRILHICSAISPTTDEFNATILKCWEVANAFQDETFKGEVFTVFFTTEGKAPLDTDSIDWAFVEGKRSEDIEQFVIDVVSAQLEPGRLLEDAREWPDVFVMELAYGVLVERRWGNLEEMRDAFFGLGRR